MTSPGPRCAMGTEGRQDSRSVAIVKPAGPHASYLDACDCSEMVLMASGTCLSPTLAPCRADLICHNSDTRCSSTSKACSAVASSPRLSASPLLTLLPALTGKIPIFLTDSSSSFACFWPFTTTNHNSCPSFCLLPRPFRDILGLCFTPSCACTTVEANTQAVSSGEQAELHSVQRNHISLCQLIPGCFIHYHTGFPVHSVLAQLSMHPSNPPAVPSQHTHPGLFAVLPAHTAKLAPCHYSLFFC